MRLVVNGKYISLHGLVLALGFVLVLGCEKKQDAKQPEAPKKEAAPAKKSTSAPGAEKAAAEKAAADKAAAKSDDTQEAAAA